MITTMNTQTKAQHKKKKITLNQNCTNRFKLSNHSIYIFINRMVAKSYFLCSNSISTRPTQPLHWVHSNK